MAAMIASLLAALALAAAPPSACRFEGTTRAWTAQALAAWDRLDAERLHVAEPVTPTATFFDRRCAYTLTPDARGDFRVGARRYRSGGYPHGGRVRLPDGSDVAVGKLAFASPVSDGGMFFIMALPALWGGDARDPRLLSMVVFMHEFAHTQQGAGLGAMVDDLLTRGLPEDANDDVVQDRFGGQPGHAAAWAAERDLFYSAAAAPDAASARTALREAARRMRERRAHWLDGPDGIYAEADDVFLTLEGTGNWAAWAWLTDSRGGAMTSQAATAFVRGGANHWSQDEGLGMMLAIDRLTPDWPALAFSRNAATGNRMIARALR